MTDWLALAEQLDKKHALDSDTAQEAAKVAGAAPPAPEIEQKPDAPLFGPYETIVSCQRLDTYIAAAIDAGAFAVDTETTSLQPATADLVGVSLCVVPGCAGYIPLGHDGVNDQLPEAIVLERLKPLLEDPRVLKIMQNGKFDWRVFNRRGIKVSPIDDTMLLSYVLDAALNASHGMDALSLKHLGHKTITFKEVTTIGRKRVGFVQVPIDAATAYAAEDADVTLRLWQLLKPRLAAENMTFIYEMLELPMIPVLARMEDRGIMIDRAAIAALSEEFGVRTERLRQEIDELAGKGLNPGSPKQLVKTLFDEMGLKSNKLTKKGNVSTDKEVMAKLAKKHALPTKIQEWRGIAKLKSTYTDALQRFADPVTDRVHTNFNLAGTITGRLSSSDPNLQNIPIKSEDGQRIRRAFIARQWHKLVVADYNQIELRVLAHKAPIPEMLAAFAVGDDADVHKSTAAGMFKVPFEEVSKALRSRAKAINFGIIYGMSEGGLARQLDIPKGEARTLFLKYHKQYPSIRPYMDSVKKFARKTVYVTTMLGRKCHYPDICCRDDGTRAYNERAAVNATIQGSAGDIIRLAMIRMEPALAAAGLSAKMLLQVHDELVFEVPDSEVEATIEVVRAVMIDAPTPHAQFTTPLKVDVHAAQNWVEAH